MNPGPCCPPAAEMPGMHMGPSAGLPMSARASGSGWPMLAAYLGAALVVGIWLAAGERVAFQLLTAAAACLFAPLSLWSRWPSERGGRFGFRWRRPNRPCRFARLSSAHCQAGASTRPPRPEPWPSKRRSSSSTNRPTTRRPHIALAI